MDKKMQLVVLFIAGAAVSWGFYVPVVHEATARIGSNLRAFLFVGVAYFLTAVLVPMLLIFVFDFDPTVTKKVNWNTGPILWGIAAGTAGAAGALFVIFAVKTAGTPLYVPPLVFAGAPIIATLVTMFIFHPSDKMPDWRFFLGLLMAAAGAALVLLYKPKPAAAHPPKPEAAATASAEPGAETEVAAEK